MSPAAGAGPRQPAWREASTRLRKAATTEPGRLRTLGAVLAAALVLFGAVTAWQVTDRATAADAVVDRSQPLSAAAADLYRSLADANTTAARGFLPGGKEPRPVRLRYEKDIGTASELLARAAANTGASSTERARIAALNSQLPVYTGLVEQARANNRQGLPLGGAYLRYASERMEKDLLPTARALYDAETDRLGSDYRSAKSWPWAALALGVLALGALGWAQRRTYLRTNRVFNHGLLAATAASGVVLLWLAVGHGVARAELEDSYEHGARSLQVLNTARISSLQARGAETLAMATRHDVLTAQGKDAYEERYSTNMRDLYGIGSGTDTADARPGSLLDRARSLADGAAGRDPVAKAVAEVKEWQQRHTEARKADDAGDYEGALARVTDEKNSTGEAFDQVDTALRQALDHEQDDFRSAADDGRDALTGLAVGAAVLAVLGATGAVLGIGRRLSEYR
ncbi:hypothetical protein [Streptomyces thioluteus]|uniref:hypothetical protein n=1 Tax=Streptomyces thioluteus TaxID=66431 RepID=UPI0031ED2865